MSSSNPKKPQSSGDPQHDAFVAGHWHLRGNFIPMWHESAQGLLETADALVAALRTFTMPFQSQEDFLAWLRQKRTRPVIHMLRGMAIECLLKATWLKRGNLIVEDGEFAGIPGVPAHQLLQMAKKTLQPERMTTEREIILEVLTRAITNGRYPIPKRQYDPRFNEWLPHSWSPAHEAVLRALVDELVAGLGIKTMTGTGTRLDIPLSGGIPASPDAAGDPHDEGLAGAR